MFSAPLIFTSTSHQLLSKLCGDSGCESDCSQPRRTSRVTTPLRLTPGMIQPSQDSRRGLFLPSLQPPPLAGSSAANPTGRKQGRSTSRSECETVVSHIASKPASQIVSKPVARSNRSGIEQKKKTSVPQSKGKKAVPTASTSTAATGDSNRNQSVAPSVSTQGHSRDLRQDSDNENARIRKKSKKSEANPERKEEVYDAIEIYFEEPTPGSEDVTPDYVFVLS
ncbi:uncharacterized protein MELLADRAFT_95800 [Melampsora larici-populina 98AG31]|uniref:Uncharacterized protein n=1 Tax=Melampsora larici-populina (strain 98AG31 / pathotype 3-4-7) TaxID=747676 RepID=F4RD96_MELLP|nr:uncharacterized protein MELLADRAFT_95800 [Melampsora larici-populina 98AG31]EGG09646.1 hypothetical protein MELLADRAFT_95800 [Melampsora larici-populina 98AG31]